VRYIGIDYSGATTPTQSLPGLQVFTAYDDEAPVQMPPPPSPRKYWTRRGLAEGLAKLLADGMPTLVGIDHGFSFPAAYFERHGISKIWDAFLDDFCAHWPTAEDNTYVDFVLSGARGNAAARMGERKWRRLTERRAKGAKSVFHFNVQGQVAASTHTGIPWLRFLRRELGGKLHFWPFDGWVPPENSTVIAEVFPSLWRAEYPAEDRNAHEHDAYVVCRWLQERHRRGEIGRYFQPSLTPEEQVTAGFEGWILGVGLTPPPATSSDGRVPSQRTSTKKTKPNPSRSARNALTAMIEEATVDCYNESEQATAFFTVIEEKLEVPFETTVLGAPVTVEQIRQGPGGHIVAICSRGRDRQAVSIVDLPLPSPLPAGAEWIDAYRYWLDHGGML
jgi:hypothetical protein